MEPYILQPTGGSIPANKIVGRKKEIDQLFYQLQAQSIRIEEFRRMGKTLFLQKLELISKQNGSKNKAFYLTVQGVNGITEFVDAIINVLRDEQNANYFKSAWNNCKKVFNKFKPHEVSVMEITFKFPEFDSSWKETLKACLQDIAERKNNNEEIITLILDELPMMLWNWVENGKEKDAMELLDVMRNLRQSLKETGNIRFVICGSISMNIVLERLQEEFRYNGEPLNDTLIFSVEAMTREDAKFLCECLILSGFECEGDKQLLIDRICDFTEGLPFYINKIFTIIHLCYSNILSAENVVKACEDLLTHQVYHSTFDQLHSRLITYYSKNAILMQGILNVLSKHEKWQTEKTVIAKLGCNQEDGTKALERLVKEQYLVKSIIRNQRNYKFKYQIFRQWWKLNKA